MSDDIPDGVGDEPPVRLFGEVVGGNVLRLRSRQGWSQTELAGQLSESGRTWTKGNVAALERGARANLTDAELIQLAATLRCSVAELYAGQATFDLGNGATITAEQLRKAFQSTESPRVRYDKVEGFLVGVVDPVAVLVAGRIGEFSGDVQRAGQALYGHSLTKERARRTGALAEPESRSASSRRGNYTRQLVAEVRDYLATEGSSQ